MKGARLKRTNNNHISISQSSAFTSPRQTIRQQNLNGLLKKQYTEMKKKENVQLVRRNINNLRGRHHSIQYKKQFDFNQKWQQQTEIENKKVKIEYSKFYKEQVKYFKYINIFLYLSKYWLISVYRTFQIPNFIFIIIPFILISQIFDVLMKKYGEENFNQKQNNTQNKNNRIFIQFLKSYGISIILGIYIIIIMIQKNLSLNINTLMTFLDLSLAILCYERFSQLYSSIKIQILSSKYRNQFYLVQLFGKCCNIVHISSIALLLSSFVNTQLNWTLSLVHFDQSWYAKYIYSVYFACTTVFTIGYGDIAPKNLLQIVVILIIQAIGVINLGFIFSEIGRILAKINEDQQNLIKNMYQSQKIAQNYRLDSTIARKMKQQIINYDLTNQKLNTHEQQKLLRMLNDDLRQKIIFMNQIHIIKHSIFFICNWSIQFQRKIANKLLMQTYRPQEPLSQVRGQQKIYILTLGKLQIVPCLFNKTNQITYRPIRKIQVKQNDQVHLNTFGYSSLISGLNIKLKAVAKDYSICYLISKEDFVNIINENEKDFEYFHEIKNRIETSITKQVWQAPKMADKRLHYHPNLYYLVKKYKKQTVGTQSRKYKRRRPNKFTFCIEGQIKENSLDQRMTQGLSQTEINQVIERNTVLTVQERKSKYDSIIEDKKPLITYRSYKKKPTINKMTTLQKEDLQTTAIRAQHLNNFDYGKNFISYFKKFNVNTSINNYNNLFSKNKQVLSTKTLSLLRPQQYKLLENYSLNQEIVDKLINIKIIEKY